VTESDSAIGRRSAASSRSLSRTGGSDARMRWPWEIAAGSAISANRITAAKKAR
jgi:hypothetical protein